MGYPADKFNRNLTIIIIVIGSFLFFKLYGAASETNNWRGMFYSVLHIVVVAAGTYFAIRKKAEDPPSQPAVKESENS
jgi:uncharacterized membrane protein YqhA